MSQVPASEGSPEAPGAAGLGAAYGRAIGAALAAALAGAAAAVAVDVARAVQLTADAGAGLVAKLVLYAAGLYAPVALVVGIAAGLVAGAARATFGPGAARRALTALRDDGTDRRATAALIAGAAGALGLAAFTAAAAMTLVAGVQRAESGALLLGAVVAATLPMWAALSLPIYRLARRVVARAPRLGPLPRVAMLALAAGLLAVASVAFVVATQLEWRGMNWGPPIAALAFATGAGGWLVVWRGMLSRLRAKVSRRGLLVAVAGGLAAVSGVATWRADLDPADRVVVAMTERTFGAHVLVGLGRTLIDRDGDGYSPFFGGPDCDDGDPDINPGATFIPGTGVDENCSGIMEELDALYAQREAAEELAREVAESDYVFDGNVLVITVDTLRADRLGVAGYRRDGRSLTPRMDALAEEGAYFTHAYAQAPNTPRSLPSMWSSKFPSQIAWDAQYKNFSTVEDENLMIWEILRDEGLITTGFSSHFYFRERRGVHQGFVEYNNEGAKDIAGSNTDTASPRIVPRVIDRLETFGDSGDRFAMFVHLFEPHSTYMEHDEFPITETGIPGLMQKYDYEIAFVDQWVGKIVDALDEHDLAEDTMILINSDHGEAFGDHRIDGRRIFFHGQALYEDQLRVPFIVYVPGLDPIVHDDPVMLIDMPPTILDALGIDIPDRFVGRSLLPRIVGEEIPQAPAYGELLPAPSWDRAATMMVTGDGSMKIHALTSEGRFELYDLNEDPDEQNNLARERPDELEALQAELTYWMDVELPAGAVDVD